MSNAYAAVSALLFAILAVMHLVRIIGRWSVVIGPNNISMNVSWVALVVSALLNLGLRGISLISARLDFPLMILRYIRRDPPRLT